MQLRLAERNLIGVGGKSLSDAFTWTSDPETSPDKASEGAPKETGDNGKGASGLERGT